MLCSRLVGRRPELEIMSRVLVAGSGGVVAVVGEAGIGKSRLVRELCNSARGRGVVVVSGPFGAGRRSRP
jgi:predicted ATPase